MQRRPINVLNGKYWYLAAFVGIILLFVASIRPELPTTATPPGQALAAAQSDQADDTGTAVAANDTTRLYIPLVARNYPWISPFGVESGAHLSPKLLNHTADLPVSWVRLNHRISWRQLQPEEDGPIQWTYLRDFEEELRALNQQNITPVVIVDDSPRWATQLPTSCGALRPDKYTDFAAFMHALVTRYRIPEFNVHHWELGNEPDVDPRLVVKDSVFGCWGDANDPFYGGRGYGEMLKVVTPAIRQADPLATVWIGGLLLDRPNSTAPGAGRPELFLQGILEAGAAPYFDVVPYHWYPSYGKQKIDYDNAAGSNWDALGGGVLGKARFLRQIMQQYGVTKPVFLNETSFSCPNDVLGRYEWCDTPDAQFYQLQASMLVRSFVRGLSEDVKGFVWYTLEGPGWRHGGLLEMNQEPKPVYIAYQQLGRNLERTTYAGPVHYGEDIEAYAFNRGDVVVHVVWARTDQAVPISVPQAKYIKAIGRDGNLLEPQQVNDHLQLMASFDPLYIVRLP